MAKRKSINLSQLLEKYNIIDNVNLYGNGGEVDKIPQEDALIKDQYDFHNKWVNSDKYKEILTAELKRSYPDSNDINNKFKNLQNKRISQETTPKYVNSIDAKPGFTSGIYLTKDLEEKGKKGNVLLEKGFSYSRPTTPIHEKSHQFVNDEELLTPNTKTILENSQKKAKDLGKNSTDYYNDPSEVYARIQAARYQASKFGIFDPTKEKFTKDHYFKLNEVLKNKKKLPDTHHFDNYDLEELLKNYSEQDVIWFLNNIADTGATEYNNSKSPQLAAYGGQINDNNMTKKKNQIDTSGYSVQLQSYGGDLASKLNPEQYGFGSWLGENAVPLLQTGVGAALTATGVGAPMGVGLMASGVGGMVSNSLKEDDPQAAANVQATAGLAGSVGGAAAGGAFNKPTEMAEGGKLTQYNGNTHANGGIPIGKGAEVEDKETRWEDYIFSERLKIPGKKYSFADASKKIEAKYSKRKNDSYDTKAKEREMKSLMAIQEAERERMELDHQNKMKEAFGYGGDMKYPEGGELPINPDGTSNINPLSWDQIAATPNLAPDGPMSPANQPATPAQLKEKDVAAAYAAQGNTPPTSIRMSGNYGNDINVTPQNTVTATDIQGGQIGNYAPTPGMANIKKWGKQVTKNIPDRTGIDGNVIPGGIQVPSAMANRQAENKKYLSMFQKETIQRAADAYAAQGEGYKAYKGFVPGQPLPDNVSLSPEQLAALYQDQPESLGKYYNRMEEQFAMNDILGISNDGFFGPKELEREGEGLKYKVREQMWGPRHANYDWSNPERRVYYARDRVTNPGVRAYGGEINSATGRVKAEVGLTPEQLLLASQAADQESGTPDDYWNARYAQNQNIPTINRSYESEVPSNYYIPNQQGSVSQAAGTQNKSNPQQFANLNNLSINVPNQQGFGVTEGGFGEMGQGFQTGVTIPDISSQINNSGNGLANEDNYTGNRLANEDNYTVGVPEKKGTGARDLGVLLGQNLGNINNIIQGAKGAEEVDLGSIDPAKVSYKAAIANANSAYDSAGKIARENIRKNATSSGQALSNLIAQNTSLTKDRAAQIASINERQENTNAQAQSQADQMNLQMRAREEDLNQRGDAASQQAMAAGLSGIGSSIAGFNKDAKANKMQYQYIQNLLNTGQYAIDPNTKQIIFLGNKTD